MHSGKTIAQYEVGEVLGRGGMGVVYKARDTKLDRTVALKFLSRELSENENAKQRFVREAKSASALDHANICTIHDIAETNNGEMYIVMAYYKGKTLRDRMDGEEFSIERSTMIIRQIAMALERAHEADIVHRDIKPANIIVTEKDEVKLLDFGLAKLASGIDLTREGSTVGTAAYMSPEQATGGEVTSASDVWSVGVVAYELLAGRKPFDGAYDQAAIYGILNEDPEPLGVLRDDVPADLENVVHRCLEKVPNERYKSAGGLLTALDTSSPVSPPTPRFRFSRRMILATLAVVAAGVLAGVFVSGLGSSDNSGRAVLMSAGSANRIAVFPFSVRGADFDYLREGMADLLSANLDGAGDLASVNQQALLNAITTSPDQTLDAENSRSISDHLDAGLFVLGNVVESAGRLRISASVYERGSGSMPVGTATAEGNPPDLFDMTDALTAQIIAATSRQPSERLKRLATRTTSSFIALKDYLEGERYRRDGRLQDAATAYSNALSNDTTFALAYYRMAEIAGYSPMPFDGDAMLDAAVRNSSQLSVRNRQLISAFYASRREGFAKAEELHREIVSRYPDEVEAWVTLGTSEMYFAGRTGRSLDNARKSLERAVYLDPENLPAIPFLWIMSIWEGRKAESDSLAERLAVLVPASEKSIQTDAWLAFSHDDQDAQEDVIRRASSAHGFEVLLSAAFVSRIPAIHTDTELYDNALRLIGSLTGPSRSAVDRYRGRWTLANLLASRGQLKAATQELKRAESINPEGALEIQVALSLMPMFNVPHNDLADLRRAVTTRFGDGARATAVKHYMAGLISIRLSELAQAAAFADSLESHVSVDTLITAMSADFALSIRAHLAHKRGSLQEALTMFEKGQPQRWWSSTDSSPAEMMSYDRFVRAELLKSLGRYDEAVLWYGGLAYAGTMEFQNAPLAFLKQAEVYEMLGRPDVAIDHYKRFVEMWKNCDPSLRGAVEAAQASITRLAT